MLELSKEVLAFSRAAEHLLSMPSPPLHSDDERAIIDYYIMELSNKYGAQKEKEPVREGINARHRDLSLES